MSSTLSNDTIDVIYACAPDVQINVFEGHRDYSYLNSMFIPKQEYIMNTILSTLTK